MEQEQKALQERIGNGEDVVVDNPTEGEQRVIEMNVGIVAGNDDSDWTEDSGEPSRLRVFHFGCLDRKSPFCPHCRTRFARVATQTGGQQ